MAFLDEYRNNNSNILNSGDSNNEGISNETELIPNSNIIVRKINPNNCLFIIHKNEENKEIGLEIEKGRKEYSFKVMNVTDNASYGQKVPNKDNLNIEKSQRDNKIIKLLEKATNLSENKLKDDLVKIGTYIEDKELFKNKYLKQDISEKKDGEYSSESTYDIRKNYAIELLAFYLREIHISKTQSKVYQYLAGYLKESGFNEEKTISLLKKIMVSANHNPEDFIPDIEQLYEDENVSKGNLKKFENGIKTHPAFEDFPKHYIHDDLHGAMKILNPKYIWFKLEESNTHSYHLEASKDIEKEFTVKRVDGYDYYYFDEDFERYELLNAPQLGVLVRISHSVSLKNQQLDSIISGIQRNDKHNPYLWNFENGIYSIEENKIIGTNKKEHFTIKNSGVLDKVSDEFTSLKYDDLVDINPNFDESKISLVQSTIQKILIPKYDKKDTDIYYDFLQRLGASFLPINRYKAISMYKGDGDNGKSLLFHILECVFNHGYCSILPEQLDNDQFLRSTVLKNKNAIIFDELARNSFKNREFSLKQLAGGGTGVHEREIFSGSVSNSENFGMIWSGTNEIPIFNYNDNAFLTRLDVLLLANKFVDKKDLDDNEYFKLENIKELIKKDIDGLNWLVSAGLKAYSDMVKNNMNFRCKQTSDKTLDLVTEEDPIERFLTNKILATGKKINSVTNKELTESFIKYVKENDIDYRTENVKSISIRMGKAISRRFPSVSKVKTADGNSYEGVRILSF